MGSGIGRGCFGSGSGMVVTITENTVRDYLCAGNGKVEWEGGKVGKGVEVISLREGHGPWMLWRR